MSQTLYEHIRHALAKPAHRSPLVASNPRAPTVSITTIASRRTPGASQRAASRRHLRVTISSKRNPNTLNNTRVRTRSDTVHCGPFGTLHAFLELQVAELDLGSRH
jgi:hypothetical protein